jgi:ankyrin repeat protein
MLAAYKGRETAAALLLDKGAAVGLKNEYKYTAYMYALAR